jgi:hypothetical protein
MADGCAGGDSNDTVAANEPPTVTRRGDSSTVPSNDTRGITAVIEPRPCSRRITGASSLSTS